MEWNDNVHYPIHKDKTYVLGMGQVKTRPEQFFGVPEPTRSIFFITQGKVQKPKT